MFTCLDTYFLPVIAYLLFSTCDFLGRVMSNFIRLVITNLLTKCIYNLSNLCILI